MRSRPERADQHEQGRARQMKIGEQRIDGAKAIAGRDEDVRPRADGLIAPCSSAALSRHRSAVVPTAMMRPPRARTSLSAAAVISSTSPVVMHRVVFGVFHLHRQKVPAPTCSVTRWNATPAAPGVEQLRREMQPRRRRGDRAGLRANTVW